MNTKNQSSKKTLEMVQLAMFTAIIFIMAFTPFLGYIPLGAMKATTIHIPVIIGSILLGPKIGAALGVVFGITSFMSATFSPTILSFAFSPFYSLGDVHGDARSLIVCFLPRILVGIVPYFVYQAIQGFGKQGKAKTAFSLAAAGIAGSLTNTLLVMNLIYFLFGQTYAAVTNNAIETLYAVIMGVIVVNGIPEALVASAITVAIGSVLIRLHFGRRSPACAQP